MGAEAAEMATEVLCEFQDVLAERLDILLQWGSEGACRLPECDLGLTRTPLGYKLVATFLGGPAADAANERSKVVRGQRVLRRGSSHAVQRVALHCARYGVRGGPVYDDGPLAWCPIALDGSLRMAVPDGELRITPLVADTDVRGAPETPCRLTFEDERRVYLLAIEPARVLQESGLRFWQRQKLGKGLRIRMGGKSIDLRSANLPGVLGYHAVAERTFIVLAWVRGEIGLYYLDGYDFSLLARLELQDLRYGEPIEVEPLLRARAKRGVPNEGPTVFTEEPPSPTDDTRVAEIVVKSRPCVDKYVVSEQPEPRIPPGMTAGEVAPMADAHRELCRRHLLRLRERLRGRGARKARVLVTVLLESLDLCRRDISGSRSEVHEELAAMVGQVLTGGDRNIRDCLDLLARESPLFHRDERYYVILFAQLQVATSELSLQIAEMDAEPAVEHPRAPSKEPETTSAFFDPQVPEMDRPEEQASSTSQMVHPSAEPVSAVVTVSSTTTAPRDPKQPQRSPSSASEHTTRSQLGPHVWAPDLHVYWMLGLQENRPSTAAGDGMSNVTGVSPGPLPSAPVAGLGSSEASISGFRWRPFFDDPNDPFDPEVETLESPSRMMLASRQTPGTKPPR